MAELTKGISQLIERIKEDGIRKGEAEQERLVLSAQEQAENIVAHAHEQARQILEDARKQEQELHHRAQSALRLAANDFITAFQHSIRIKHVRPLIVDNVGALLADEAFLGETLQILFRDYVASGGKAIEVIVNPTMKRKLTAWMAKNLEDALEKEGISIKEEPHVQGFMLNREDEGFSWDFSLEMVSEELMRLLEPGLRAYLKLKPDSAEGERQGGS